LPETWTHCPGSTGYDIGVLPVTEGDTVVLRYPYKLRADSVNHIIEVLKPQLPDGVKVLVVDAGAELNVVHKEAS
jgi:hypothetical protein